MSGAICGTRMSRSLSSGAHSRDPLAHPGYRSLPAKPLQLSVGRIPLGKRVRAIVGGHAEQPRGVVFRALDQRKLAAVEVGLAKLALLLRRVRVICGGGYGGRRHLASGVISPMNSLIPGAGHAFMSSLALACTRGLGRLARRAAISPHSGK